jgi:hypothetical protein
MSFPWLRYDGDYTSGWDNPAKKKTAAKKTAAKKTSAKAKKARKPKRG